MDVSGGNSGSGGGHGGLLWTSALSAMATVAASLPSFLSPHLPRIMAIALRPAAGGSDGTAGAASKRAADRVLSLLAAGVEPRLLVPAVCGAYNQCVEGGVGRGAIQVARLLAYVQEVRNRESWWEMRTFLLFDVLVMAC